MYLRAHAGVSRIIREIKTRTTRINNCYCTSIISCVNAVDNCIFRLFNSFLQTNLIFLLLHIDIMTWEKIDYDCGRVVK